MIAAVLFSSGAHAILALLISATSPPESNALHLPPTYLHVRLVSAERVHATAKVSEPPEQVTAPGIVRTTQAGGGADGPVASVSSSLVTRHDIGESHASALAAAFLHFDINDRDTLTSAPVEATIVPQEELDAQPVPIDPVIPNYPPENSSASAGGLIKLQLLIDEVGRVTSVDVLESALPEAFGVSATRAFEAVRFRPGLRDGLPVRCRITTSIQFAPTALAQMTTAQPDAQVGQRE